MLAHPIPKALVWEGACPPVEWPISCSPGCHVCPGRGIEFRMEEVSCFLGWASGQVSCGQVCNRLRERPLQCGAWGWMSLLIAFHQKPGWGGGEMEAGKQCGALWDSPAPLLPRNMLSYTPCGRTRAMQTPAWPLLMVIPTPEPPGARLP